ncbi:MAG: hypothetical protein KDD99_30980, partial [Bacteroidetes bacterium]|nr:hypothetical protein [Bacteroidota bacterium]
CRDEPNPDNSEIQGCVAVINTENHTLVKKIFGVGHAPHGISIDRSGQRIFVSSENLGGKDEVPHPIEGISGPSGKYHLIDMGTLEVVKEMERQLGIFPSGLVISD